MKTRLELQETLEELLGSRNVYYEPPANIKMEYPAIVYSRDNIQTRFASNKVFRPTALHNIQAPLQPSQARSRLTHTIS